MDELRAAAREEWEVGTNVIPDDSLFQRDGSFEGLTEFWVGTRLGDQFTIVKHIEAGGYGRGWVAVDGVTGRQVFLKTFRSGRDRPLGSPSLDYHVAMVEKEVDIVMKAADAELPAHPAVVSASVVLFGAVSVPSTGRTGALFFVVSPDLCEGGELYNYLVIEGGAGGVRSMDERLARTVFKQLAEGVGHLHSHGIFHRDLKLENVVLDSNFQAKIMDFGHAKLASECVDSRYQRRRASLMQLQATGVVPPRRISAAGATKDHLITSTWVGTESYQPPELTPGDKKYSPAAFDMWSLGVMLFFCVGIEALAATGNNFSIMQKVRKKEADYFTLLDDRRDEDGVPDNEGFWRLFEEVLEVSDELVHLLNGLFDHNPSSRMTIERVLAHPWLKGDTCTHEELVIELSHRSKGFGVESHREVIAIPKAAARTAESAAQVLAAAIEPLAPFREVELTDHEIQISAGAIAKFTVGEPDVLYSLFLKKAEVELVWVGGSLAQWLEFRSVVHDQLDAATVAVMRIVTDL